jgi:hypothetical protein
VVASRNDFPEHLKKAMRSDFEKHFGIYMQIPWEADVPEDGVVRDLTVPMERDKKHRELWEIEAFRSAALRCGDLNLSEFQLLQWFFRSDGSRREFIRAFRRLREGRVQQVDG